MKIFVVFSAVWILIGLNLSLAKEIPFLDLDKSDKKNDATGKQTKNSKQIRERLEEQNDLLVKNQMKKIGQLSIFR